MKNLLALASLVFMLFAISTSCNKEKKADQTAQEDSQTQAILAPDSELTLLMREMFNETALLKEQVINGESIRFDVKHEGILTAHPSDPSKTAPEEFKIFSEQHLQSLKKIQEADSSQMLTLYNGLIDNCMSCHKVVCPGPINRIKTLKVSNTDLIN